MTSCMISLQYLRVPSYNHFKGIANLMLKSSLFILFCKTDADFHQMARFIL